MGNDSSNFLPSLACNKGNAHIHISTLLMGVERRKKKKGGGGGEKRLGGGRKIENVLIM